MSNETEDFDKLRKLLVIKRHEQPPPGYYSRFSGLVITRIERDAESHGTLSEVPWLRKFFGLFESSPVAAGLFGSALCAVIVGGIAMANRADKAPVSAYAPVATGNLANNSNTSEKDADSVALISHSAVSGRSTDAVFGSNIAGSPFGADARLQPVAFTTVAHQ